MKPIRHILVPTDFSDTARNALEYAMRMAHQLGARLSVVHVVYPDYDMAMDVTVVAAQVTEEKIANGKVLLERFVQSVRETVWPASAAAPEVETRVVAGMPVDAIVRQTKKRKADLVILGTRGEHSNWEEWLGTVALGVARQAPCQVLVIPEKAAYHPFDKVACATDLTASTPFHIWKVAKLLQDFSPAFYCVHVKNETNGRFHLELEELQEFYRSNLPSVEIGFFDLEGESTAETLNAFAEEQQVDLLVVFRQHRHFLDRLFHKSVTHDLAIRCSLPLLVVREGS